MASLDSGQSGFLQQEDPGNQVCFPLLHSTTPLFSSQCLAFIPVDFFHTSTRGLLHPGLKLRGNTFA